MRVISGYLGGRTFSSPKSHGTHPMSEKVLGAMFNSLGDIEGLNILDAFSGSGAISYEAISRGASHVTAVEKDRAAQVTIESNIQELGITNKIKLIKANVLSWSNLNQDAKFDIVILDPPYDSPISKLADKLACHTISNGLLVLSLPGNMAINHLTGFRLLNNNSYGDAQLIYYRAI